MGSILQQNLGSTQELFVTFIEKANKYHNNKYDYSKSQYINNKIRIEIICKIHGSFWQTPSRHLENKGCQKCRTSIFSSKEAFIKKSQQIFGDKYDYSKAIYVNNDTALEIICKIHGSFWRRPRTHTCNAGGCPQCYAKPTLNPVERAKVKFNNKYTYTKTDSKVVITCPKHGIISANIHEHVKSTYGCKECYEEARRMSVSKFVELSNTIHSNKYDYSKVKFNNISDEVVIICPIHGDFTHSANEHVYGQRGCPKCSDRTIGLDEFIRQSNIVHHNKYDYSKSVYRSVNHKIEIICPEHGSFWQQASYHLIGQNGCKRCTTSSIQNKVLNHIKEHYAEEILEGNTTVIKPYELDIYLPKLRLAIEVNGNYWHSYNKLETTTQKMRHHAKATLCQQHNIQLMQFTETEINDRWPIVCSMINHKLGLSTKVYARECSILELNAEKSRKFLDESHIAGFCGATVYYALCYNNTIYAMATFTKKNGAWEIMRFANKLNYTAVGGFSKLLSHFVKKCNPNKLITYSDRRFSNQANLYASNGFKLIGVTKPNYVYLTSGANFAGSRQKFQKHKLHKILPNFKPFLSESENMFGGGFRRLWDAGHFKFVMRE